MVRFEKDTLIEVSKETRKALKMQAILEGCTLKEYVALLAAREQQARAQAEA